MWHCNYCEYSGTWVDVANHVLGSHPDIETEYLYEDITKQEEGDQAEDSDDSGEAGTSIPQPDISPASSVEDGTDQPKEGSSPPASVERSPEDDLALHVQILDKRLAQGGTP